MTNILRHSTATSCTIELVRGPGTVRLRVSNDVGAEPRLPGLLTGPGTGRGLANLATRVQAAGGQLTTTADDGHFGLHAEIPLAAPAAGA